MNQQHLFSNPYQPVYHSALVNTTTQGVLTLSFNETMDMNFAVDFKQEMVSGWKSFFKTETTDSEFK